MMILETKSIKENEVYERMMNDRRVIFIKFFSILLKMKRNKENLKNDGRRKKRRNIKDAIMDPFSPLCVSVFTCADSHKKNEFSS